MLLADRKDEADLRTDAEHPALELAEPRSGAVVAGELLEQIARHADLHVLAEELRRAPVDVKIDAVLVVGVRIDEVVRGAHDDREFVPRLGVEIGVAHAAIHCDKAEAEIGESAGIIGAARDVACDIDHGVVDALIPFQCPLVEDVRESRALIAGGAGDAAASWTG